MGEKKRSIQVRCSDETERKWRMVWTRFSCQEDAMLYYIDNFEKIKKCLSSERPVSGGTAGF